MGLDGGKAAGNDLQRRGGRLVVLGGGESGTGAAVLGKKEGYEVFVSDQGPIKEAYKNVLIQTGIDWEEGSHTTERLLEADLCVKSPGIPDSVPLLVQMREAGIPIVSEIEFGSWFTEATLIAITGSNGKTTTALLTYHLLKEGGLDVGLGGNIGDSFALKVAREPRQYYVLEVSSFQLDGIRRFHPHIAVITNITPDHLDRYQNTMELYIRAKLRIFENQTREDHFIYDLDDPVLSEWIRPGEIRPRIWPFSLEQPLSKGASIAENEIHIRTDNNLLKMNTDSLALEGLHNVKNTMAAATVARLLGIRKESIRQSVANFQGAPHRLEKVLKIQHVQYVNDSKATNVNATFYALDSMTTPVVWIVGGVDKGNDYRSLLPLVREKVRAIVCLGLDNSRILETFGNVVDLVVETYAMTEAVKVAYKIAERGDTVLLSPACASFDLFKNYEDRGDQFKNAVKSL
ncbi:MAG: UDP-N-acetylmuramoyl-L-alanine--D-glutamate ligase [Robiginitalea sp.]|nr:UDP-N-acetylmuramoyl-L-alanine--D-glutamate ligase [Robiginitalea sp.]